MVVENQEDSKTFWEHLIVLRRYLGISFVSILVFSIVAHQFYRQIIEIIFLPLHGKQLVFLSVTDPVFFIFKVDFFAGLLVSLPIISWFAFKFITPAFSKQTKSKIVSFVLVSVSLTVAAICYSYFIIAPLLIKFLLTITVTGVQNLITAQSYINFLLAQMMISAIVFQIPLVMVIGTYWGLLNPYNVVKKRGWVYMSAVIGIGFFVPPDMFSHIVTIVPTLLIFEISIIICKVLYNRNFNKKNGNK